jgi:sodium transport system ATP-binding protein
MITVDAVHKEFDSFVAVDDVSFVAHDGAITAVLGPNGAGKTTTLRMVTALVPPDRGRVVIDGLDVAHDVVAVRRRIGALPHAHGLYPRLTSREHVRYFARLHGIDDVTSSSRADALFEILEMRDIADRRTEGFSQGQKLKVALARALVHDPQNLVLDEPTAGLDVTGIRAMRTFLQGQKAAGRCVVFSTHVMQEVVALADHIVIVAGGRVMAAGTIEALRALAGHDDLEEVFARLVAARPA